MMKQRHFSLNPAQFLLIQEQLGPLYLLDIKYDLFCRNQVPKAAQLTAIYVPQDKRTDCGNRFRHTEMYLHKGRIGPVFLGLLYSFLCIFPTL